MFDANPNIRDENQILDAAWPLAVTALGNKRAMSVFNYDADFPSDLVSVYGWLQKDQQGMAEGVADMHSNELLNTVRGAIRKAIKETGDQSLSKIFVCLRDARPASEALKNITSPNSLAEVDNALQEVGIDFDDLLDFINKQAEKYGGQGVAEGQVNELSSDLLKRAAQVAKNKRDQSMDPKIHDALGGGYMNPVARHYDTMSDKFSQKATSAAVRDKIKDIGISNVVQRKIAQKPGVAEGKRNLKCVCKTHGQDQCPVHAPIDEGSNSSNKNKKA